VSPRSHLRLGLVALALAALAACNDSSTQPQQSIQSPLPPNLALSTSCRATEVYQIITWLTPLRNAPLDLRGPVTVVLTFSAYKQAIAQRLVLKFAESLTPEVIATLRTPPNPPYATKEAAVAVLVADLMQCVGLETAPPPPAAYLPTGGLKVIDETGGQFTTNDEQAGLHAPAGAVMGPHLFYIVDLSDPATAPVGLAAAATTCLPPRANVVEVGRCYDFSVIPDVGAKKDGQGFGGNGVYAAVCSPGDHPDEVHDHLELAKVDHNSNPPTFTIYPRSEDVLTGSMSCDLGHGPPPPSASIMGSAMSKMVGALKVLASPFAPKVANAADGVGSLFADLTHVSLVYRVRPLTVSPASATVIVGGSQGLTAAPTDERAARSGPYVWSINGVDVGSDGFSSTYGTLVVSDERAATFTAPAAVPAPATFDVCVRRQAAPADRGCSAVTVQGNFVGNWVGTIVYQDVTPQPVTLNVTSQSANSASGELFIATATDPTPYNTTSHFTGVVDGDNLSFTMPQFTENSGAVVNVTRSGSGANEQLSGTMSELFAGQLGRTFSASLSRAVVIGFRAGSRPTLSQSAEPNASSSATSSTPFGVRTP
jgi:hypothetical protein